MSLLTIGASMATLFAMVTAWHTKLGSDAERGTVYLTDQADPSLTKALRLGGFPQDAVRVVPVDGHLRMDLDALTAAIHTDRVAGSRPWCVVATAGTTSTGTIDPLAAIAHIASCHRMWFHVDASYGGFFQLTERGRRRLRGIERADSVVLDPHRSLLPSFGVDGFRSALDEKLDLAEYVYRELADDPNLIVLAAPELSTVAFRHRSGDEATLRLLDGGPGFLSGTSVHGRYTARVRLLDDHDGVAEAVAAVRAGAAAIVRRSPWW